MTLKTLFAIPIAIILLVTLSLAGTITSEGWSGLERGRAAVAAVERMQVLLTLQGSLGTERITTNVILAAPYPLPDPSALRLAAARRDTDRLIAALNFDPRSMVKDVDNVTHPDRDLLEVVIKLGVARAATDALVALDRPERTFAALNALVPLMLAPHMALEDPLASATDDVIAADPSMSGLLAVARIASSLREVLSRVAAVLMPRFNKGQPMTPAEMAEVRRRLGIASELTRLLGMTIEIAGPTERLRKTVSELKRADDSSELLLLSEVMDAGPLGAVDDDGFLRPQRVLIPWGNRIAALRTAILDETVDRVVANVVVRERQFDLAMTAFGLVMIAILESVVSLGNRVVGPLAQLGLAITRIAAGDRGVALTMLSGTREINEMVTAVETLRLAALVADAAVIRHRVAARLRFELLCEALGIVQTVQESAHALERGVARLSEGIDATIALVTAATAAPPATLGTAADAVRVGLAEMRDSAADLDATFAAASSAQTEGRPEAEFRAHILAVQAQVDRRDVAVRLFVQPSLVALRDAASASGKAPGPVLHDLVSDLFERIEETVATVALMLAAVTRATAIVRDLPLDDTPMAA